MKQRKEKKEGVRSTSGGKKKSISVLKRQPVCFGGMQSTFGEDGGNVEYKGVSSDVYGGEGL